MPRQAAATRSDMARIQAALKLARRGHDLLERKRRILMAELVSRIEDVREVQSGMRDIFAGAYSGLRMANISMGIENVERVAGIVPEEDRFVIRLRSIMGMDIPEVDPLEPACSPVYSLGGISSGTSSVLDNAYVRARSLVPLIARLAEVETSVYRLAVQIRRTVRRVNALEKVFIPRCEAQVRSIAAALEENEREDMTRIKLSSGRET